MLLLFNRYAPLALALLAPAIIFLRVHSAFEPLFKPSKQE
jgi:hypothetical protein